MLTKIVRVPVFPSVGVPPPDSNEVLVSISVDQTLEGLLMSLILSKKLKYKKGKYVLEYKVRRKKIKEEFRNNEDLVNYIRNKRNDIFNTEINIVNENREMIKDILNLLKNGYSFKYKEIRNGYYIYEAYKGRFAFLKEKIKSGFSYVKKFFETSFHYLRGFFRYLRKPYISIPLGSMSLGLLSALESIKEAYVLSAETGIPVDSNYFYVAFAFSSIIWVLFFMSIYGIYRLVSRWRK